MKCSEHKYSEFYKHRYLIFGVFSALCVLGLPLIIKPHNELVIYKISLFIFIFYCCVDFFTSRKVDIIYINEYSIKSGDLIIPFTEIKYVHTDPMKATTTPLDGKGIVLIYNDNEEFSISSKVSGFDQLLEIFQENGIPTNT